MEQLIALLDFDAGLIAAFAGFSMLITQMAKTVSQWISDHALLFNGGLAIVLSTLVVFQVYVVLAIVIIAFLIMTASSGVYSAVKSKTEIVLEDYSDET